MMLNASDLALVLAEMTPVLQNGWIQKIQQPRPRMIVVDIRVPGQTHRLLISCEPDTARLHLTTRPHLNPPTPPPFCQFLRAHIQGARLDEIRQIGNDRIVELQITSKEGPRTIVCELTGKKANLLVLDAERHVLRDLAHQRDRVGPAPCTCSNGRAAILRNTGLFPGVADHPFPVSEAIEMPAKLQKVTSPSTMPKWHGSGSEETLKRTAVDRSLAWRLGQGATYRGYARCGELSSHLALITKESIHHCHGPFLTSASRKSRFHSTQ